MEQIKNVGNVGRVCVFFIYTGDVKSGTLCCPLSHLPDFTRKCERERGRGLLEEKQSHDQTASPQTVAPCTYVTGKYLPHTG